MVKKYYVDKDSVFAKSIILPFFENDNVGFFVDGLDFKLKRELFNPKTLKINTKTNEVDSKSFLTYCSVVYLDDQLNIRAIILYSQSAKLYFCFRLSNQNEFTLRFQNNYVDKDSKNLEMDFEKSLKKKGTNHFNGIGDFEKIRNFNYFDIKYIDQINPRIDKKSNISRLIFTENNKFTADFINLVDRNLLSITNKSKLGNRVLSLETMAKLKTNRKDCLFVNFSTGNIDYFVYTYRPLMTNHYLLFKYLGKDKYEFVAEDICFNKLLLKEETKNLYFKPGTDFASKALSKMNYEDLSERYLEFSEDEEIDEEFNSEWILLEQLKQENRKKQFVLDLKLETLLKDYGCTFEDNVIYFRDFETIPLGAFGENHIKIKQNRLLTDLSLTNQISLKDLNKIEQNLKELLHNKPSSRLMAIEKLVDSVIDQKLDNDSEEQRLLIQEIENNFQTLWASDKSYPADYFKTIFKKYDDWKNNSSLIKEINEKQSKKQVIKKTNIDIDMNITLHASLRMDERIGKMSDEEKLLLAKEAYSNGFTSVHFYEKNNLMFSFLQHQQNKYSGKTLRLHNDFIYIFSLKAPHDLITCFPIKDNYDRYVSTHKSK